MHTYFPFQILGIPLWAYFDAEGGVVRNLGSLIRTGDCNLDLDPETGALIVSGHLGLSVLHVSNFSTLISFDRKSHQIIASP
jgi:hypothetical protein